MDERIALPSISVITFVKNGAPYIARAIESVLEQNYPALEYIVIDGASTDGTFDIIRQYELHLAHCRSEPDRGAWDAANKGISIATGEIVVFLMGDDWFAPDALTEIGHAFARNPQCDVISSGAKLVRYGDNGSYETIAERHGRNDDLSLDNVLYIAYSMARYYRRDALHRIGPLSHRYPMCHDVELLIRMIAAGFKSTTINKSLYNYFVHSGSTTLHYRPDTMRRILDEHREMALALSAQTDWNRDIRNSLIDWAIEQEARRTILELRSRHVGASLRIFFSHGLYKPSSLAALWRRYRSIRAVQHRLKAIGP